MLNSRKVDGSTNKFPIVSTREYLFDAAFTLCVGICGEAEVPLERIAAALRRPAFTPTLGRRSCPIARPLLETETPIEALDALDALSRFEPLGGPIYTEGNLISDKLILLRDVPSYGDERCFNTRRVYLHREEKS